METSHTLENLITKDNIKQCWKGMKWHYLVEGARPDGLWMPQRWKVVEGRDNKSLFIATATAYKTVSFVRPVMNRMLVAGLDGLNKEGPQGGRKKSYSHCLHMVLRSNPACTNENKDSVWL